MIQLSILKSKRILTLLSALFILISYASVFIAGTAITADAAPDSASGGVVPSSVFTDGVTIAEHDSWVVGDEYSKKVLSSKSGKVTQISSDNEKIYTYAVPDSDIDSGEYSEVGVNITSVANSQCTVTLTALMSSGSTISVTEKIANGVESYVFLSLGNTYYSVTNISIEVTLKDSGKDARILLGTAVLSKADHAQMIENYSAFSVSGIGDDLRVQDTEAVEGRPVITDGKGDSFAIVLDISGSGGGVTFHYSEDGGEFSASGSAVITKDRTKYIFHSGSIGDSSAYKLEFTGIGDKETTLNSISFIQLKKSSVSQNLGAVTKCYYDEDTSLLTVTGTVTRDSVIEHIDGDICLFEVPLWDMDSVHLYSIDPVASADMSNSFSFSVGLSQDRSALSSFVIAIRSHGKLYPLSDPVFPSRETLPEGINALASVSGISPEDAFSAGFDNFVMDIDVASLFIKKSTDDSVLFTFDGDSYYASKDIVTDIEKNVSFLKAAGMGIIFNLSGTDSFSADSETSCRTIAAATSFLSQKYSPYGFMVTSPDGDNISDVTHTAAALTRLVSAAAVSDSVVYTMIPDGDEAYAWLLSHYMARLPKMNGRLYIPALQPDNSIIAAVEASAAAGGYQSGITVSVDASGKDAESVIETISDGAKHSYIIRITDSLSHNFSLASEKKLDAIPGNIKLVNGSYVNLWDFTTSYDWGGFTVSPGSAGIYTRPDAVLEDATGIRSCRAVKTVLDSDSRVLIATPDNPVNLTKFPHVSFLMSLETDAPVTLDIMFISGSTRAVYTVVMDSSGVYAPVCDLSGTEIEQRIDCIALVLKDGDRADIGIATVSASGERVSSEDALDIYITETTAAETADDTDMEEIDDRTKALYICIGVAAAMSLLAFTVLTVKKA